MKKNNLRKSIFYLIAIISIFVLATVSVSAASEYAYKYSGKAYDASINYLNEFYLEKHPDFALKNSYGSPNDWAYLENALKPIIKGCRTDAEKATAITEWVKENIEYKTKTFSFPKDVYVTKKADCLGDSYLIQQFLRMCDIPAVVCVGWRGDLVGTIDKDFIDNSGYSRHAWVVAYIDSQWKLYDILFDVYAETDRQFISEWYFFESLEGVAPYYDKNAIMWHFDGSGCFYRNGNFYCYYNGKPHTDISIGWNDLYHQINCRAFEDEINLSYLDSSRKNPGKYEVFTDGFIQYYKLNYPIYCAQYNGIMPTATINKVDGKYYMFAQNGDVLNILNHIDEYYMINGAIYIADGEKIPVYPTHSKATYNDPYDDNLRIKYESADPEKFSIDEDGTVHLKDGYDKADTCITMDIVNKEGSTKYGFVFTAIILSDEHKHSEDNDYHTYKTISCTPATMKKTGKMVKKCSGCSKEISYTIPTVKSVKIEKTSFDYTGEAIKPFATIKDSEGKELIYGADYIITCKNNRKLGTGTITVNFIGKYSGTISKTFKIILGKPSEITITDRKTDSLSLSWVPIEGATQYYLYVYDKKKDKYVLLKKTKYTDFDYKNLTPGKTYKFRVKAVHKKNGETYSSSFTYLTTATKPKKTALSTLKSKKKNQAVITWKTVSGATGYIVTYSTSKKFTDKTTRKVTVSDKKTKKITLKKLRSNKKYYVKVRAYKTVGGKKIYGSYSSVKTVKVK